MVKSILMFFFLSTFLALIVAQAIDRNMGD